LDAPSVEAFGDADPRSSVSRLPHIRFCFFCFSLYSGLYNRFDIRACQSRADIGRRYRYQRPRRESSIRQVTCGALFGLPSIVAGAAV
jgi:hypothetical protein